MGFNLLLFHEAKATIKRDNLINTQRMTTNKNQLDTLKEKNKYLWPYVLVTTLFFLWGFAHSILDILNKHFQDSLHISKTESALVQTMVYGAYFLMAIPAGKIIKHFGYKWGVLTGLLLYGVGALLFIPGGQLLSFPFFLFSLFVIGCGLACLETSANPYVTVLGSKEGAARRINLSQSFNGLGWMVGPLIGGMFVFSDNSHTGSISTPYAIIGVIVLAVACIFARVKLPEVEEEEEASNNEVATSSQAITHHHATLWTTGYTFGLIALFLYVAAQTGINSFFINYVTEIAHVDKSMAAMLLGFGGMGLFMVGRMAGSALMLRIKAERVLLFCAIGATLSMFVLLMGASTLGIVAFFICYLCESIMFPTIFALALGRAGKNTKIASSYLIMSIVGGAIAPVIMGLIADHICMAKAFIVPLFCFVIIVLYAAYTLKERK